MRYSMTFQIFSSPVILWYYDWHSSLTKEIFDTKKVTLSLGEQVFSNVTNGNDEGVSIHWLTKTCLVYFHGDQIGR